MIKEIKTLLVVFTLLFSYNVKSQQVVEGLYYKDMKPVRLTISDGKIKTIVPATGLADSLKVIIAPGFIDNQINGFAGVSFSFGTNNLTKEGVLKATHALWKEGVTTYMPTLTTNSTDVLIRNLKILAKAVNDEELKGSIPGFHLEGPYINPEDGFRGAHPKQFVSLPDWDKFMELYYAAESHIMEITLAPELEGAQEFILKCSEYGIVVALGHHNANNQQISQAVYNGAKISTHLGNGCANMINRHNNPLWPQLANDDITASIICDGFHLLPEEIKVFYKVKGADNIIITSDVTSYAALEPGKYITDTGEEIELTKEGMLRYPAQNVLYGSASSIKRGVGHIMEVTDCKLSEAIQMSSTNQARLFSLDDRGRLEPGKRADIILFDLDNYKINIKKTFVNGTLVYEADK